jgi:hypothetical protein
VPTQFNEESKVLTKIYAKEMNPDHYWTHIKSQLERSLAKAQKLKL